MTLPDYLVNSWSMIGAVLEKPKPDIVCKAMPDVTCEEWRACLPAIRDKIRCLLLDPTLQLDMDGEKVDNARALKSLSEFVLAIESFCSARNENEADIGIVLPDVCGDGGCW